ARTLPGFEFLSNLGRQSAASATGLGSGASAVPGMPPMSHWIAPVFDPEELDKRIQDLRTVHFWLDQNTKALAATIQALELQKMTLLTLKSMNVSMQEMAEAFTVKPPAPDVPAAPAAAARTSDRETRQQEGSPAQTPGAAEATPPAVDPMQWWSALTEQFQTIANGALRDMSEHASRAAEQMAQSVQAGTEAMASAQAAVAVAPASAVAEPEATPRASDPPQSASAKPQKRRPPAPRAPRASS
ncbi:MAG: hypothetical protein Q7T22_06055, partial [Serpentinimonas sp.]|nr:hypothetical protein [Serpentinimonas sp.]